MTEIFNRTTEKEKRRSLRAEMPRAERLLWTTLREKQMAGSKFRRQYSVGPYIVDFYCPALKLAIELDGDSHFGEGAEQRDAARQQFIESFGIRFLRFTNHDIFHSLELVIERIEDAVISTIGKRPPSVPPSEGGK